MVVDLLLNLARFGWVLALLLLLLLKHLTAITLGDEKLWQQL